MATPKAPKLPPALPKRYLTTAEVGWVYGCTADYLEAVPVDDLPRNKRGHRTVLYDVMDCERHFARFRVAGDERRADRRELPTALPVAVFVAAA